LKLRGEGTDVAIFKIHVARKLQPLWERLKRPSEFIECFTHVTVLIHDFMGYCCRSVRVIKQFGGKIQVLVQWWQPLSYATIR